MLQVQAFIVACSWILLRVVTTASPAAWQRVQEVLGQRRSLPSPGARLNLALPALASLVPAQLQNLGFLLLTALLDALGT